MKDDKSLSKLFNFLNFIYEDEEKIEDIYEDFNIQRMIDNLNIKINEVENEFKRRN